MSAARLRASALAIAIAVSAAACEREERRFQEVAPAATASPAVTLNDKVQPGPTLIDPEIRNAYEDNAWAMSEGQRLYAQWNCAGCHATRGGGGMGPPFIDSVWIYGSEPENVHQSIVQGRPNGMPAFRGRISNADVWKIAGYVRQLAGLTPMTTRSARMEEMHNTSTDPQSDPKIPMDRRIPPESKPPAPRPPR